MEMGVLLKGGGKGGWKKSKFKRALRLMGETKRDFSKRGLNLGET